VERSIRDKKYLVRIVDTLIIVGFGIVSRLEGDRCKEGILILAIYFVIVKAGLTRMGVFREIITIMSDQIPVVPNVILAILRKKSRVSFIPDEEEFVISIDWLSDVAFSMQPSSKWCVDRDVSIISAFHALRAESALDETSEGFEC
jgi:hypothetical protein